MGFLYLLESIRTPFLDTLMMLLTRLGEETAFLAVALVFFWCIDKRKGYYIMGVGLTGTLAAQFLKLTCRVPRPWMLDPNFTIVEKARAGAYDYSFPSGHTQSAVAVFGSVAMVTKKKWLRICCIVAAVLVPVSRMYLGVHTPLDVSVGALISLVLLFALRPVFLEVEGKRTSYALAGMLVLAAGYLCYAQFWPFPADIDAGSLAGGQKNAYTLLGALLGLILGYILDEKVTHFSVKACPWVQVLKALGGLIVTVAVMELTKKPLDVLFNGHLFARLLRYTLTTFVASGLWPMTFRWFGKLSKEQEK